MKQTVNCPPNPNITDSQLDLFSTGIQLNLNFFERSQIPLKVYFHENNFEETREKSMKLFGLDSPDEHKDYFLVFKTPSNNGQTTEDSIYNVLSFQRGLSEHQDLNNQIDFLHHQKTTVENFTPDINKTQLVDINATQDYETGKTIQSQKQSKLIIKEKEENNYQKEENQYGGQQKRISTKNVTKNMGKLLFRWIWANRSTLQLKFNENKDDWSKFIQQVKQWKKENNITRKFLCQKWQGNEATCKLFRIISAHFFRKKCLASIYQSSIQDKMMHIKRVSKFLQAVSNSTALDSLN